MKINFLARYLEARLVISPIATMITELGYVRLIRMSLLCWFVPSLALLCSSAAQQTSIAGLRETEREAPEHQGSSTWEPLINSDVPSGAASPTLVVQLGHSAELTAVAFSTDGRLLATAGADKDIIIWDVMSGKQVRKFETNSAAVDSIEFSLDDTNILTGSPGETIL